MKRALSIAGILLAVAWTPLHSTAHRGFPNQAPPEAKRRDVEIAKHKSTATIVFRGLIVLRPDPARNYFDVGILKAPEHEFRMQVRENSPNGVSAFSVPLSQPVSSQSDVWSLRNEGSIRQRINFYQGEAFDRTRGIGDERDARWLVDLEGPEFYQRRLPMNADQLSLVLRVPGSEFHTKRLTAPLMRRRGDGAFQYFGRVADEFATDISLDEGDLVLRSKKTGQEILKLKKKPGTTYEIIIENAFADDHRMASGFAHFFRYYDLVSPPKAEWYDFREVSGADFGRTQFRQVSYLNTVIPGTDRAPCMPIMLGGGH